MISTFIEQSIPVQVSPGSPMNIHFNEDGMWGSLGGDGLRLQGFA